MHVKYTESNIYNSYRSPILATRDRKHCFCWIQDTSLKVLKKWKELQTSNMENQVEKLSQLDDTLDMNTDPVTEPVADGGVKRKRSNSIGHQAQYQSSSGVQVHTEIMLQYSNL